MGCNCGKKAQQRRSGLTASARRLDRYKVTHPDGTTTVHGTRLEADAANARRGGKGQVLPR